ncbi:hypothetical protein B0T22DRAFT_534866 [Podospora appendiculata]|uniref:RING-type domain-containing protein n=1 Tax=Podospora appendiculata TaxID=314037 RepID=A0AAE0X7E6_9PEZI|nr:hypothetical protein B0T22DRAFT_534866 [Podospora appendiculata]
MATAQPHAVVPAPIATGDQHVCFICLQNEVDTPNATWVNPCPCSLEAHEDCMLRWVAETEQNTGRNKSGLRCPACRAPINVDEPSDVIVSLQNQFRRRYGRAAPIIVLFIVTSGSIAGSACYGASAASIFAGSEAVAGWVEGGGPHARGGRLQAFPLFKILALAGLGPGLVITRGLPWLGNFLTFPMSLLYTINLVGRDELLSWPPSPEWAVALMPIVHMGYHNLYYGLFGPLEKRLNRALRGRPPVDELPAPREGAENAPPPAARRPEERDAGLLATTIALANAVVGLFGNDPAMEGELDFEVRIGVGDAQDDGEDFDDDLAFEQAIEEVPWDAPMDLIRPIEPIPEERDLEQQHAANHEDDHEQPQNQPQPQPQNGNENQIPPAAPRPQQQNEQLPAPPPAEDNRLGSIITDIISSVATSLMFPSISYGMGELIRLAAPPSWTARPGYRRLPTGLLQQQWGRSLVGGCLFVVLKDAFTLYAKYRRVQVKQHRKVRNVEKKARRGN